MLILLLLVILTGCARQPKVAGPYIPKKPTPTTTERPGYLIHTVKRGETVWAISKIYNVSPQTIIQVNRIGDVTDIDVGTKLLIPRRDYSSRTASAHSIVHTKVSGKGFVWPLRGRILRYYDDIVNGHKNLGIDIEAQPGQDVLAAKGGVVEVVSKNPGGWGNVIVIRHRGGFHTWYAHNSKILVRKGSWVRPGQVIALAGQSGSVTRPELHFKIFRNDRPVDPLSYLSQQ